MTGVSLYYVTKSRCMPMVVKALQGGLLGLEKVVLELEINAEYKAMFVHERDPWHTHTCVRAESTFSLASGDTRVLEEDKAHWGTRQHKRIDTLVCIHSMQHSRQRAYIQDSCVHFMCASSSGNIEGVKRE